MDFSAIFSAAFALVIGLDPAFLAIVGLSLRVTLTAVLIAALIGLPLGAALALARFPGRAAVIEVMVSAVTSSTGSTGMGGDGGGITCGNTIRPPASRPAWSRKDAGRPGRSALMPIASRLWKRVGD